ncbi:MAG: hypothetical protein ABIQ88_07055 [Chitinophagaceae bacterium]
MPLLPPLTYEKIVRKLKGIFLAKVENTPLQFRSYAAYWHYKLYGSLQENTIPGTGLQHYIAERPNYGAGIGHQLANWNAGLYYAQLFKQGFAHFPFSNKKWEFFLGFGENETDANALLRDRSFKKVRLPRFNSESETERVLIDKIIHSYRSKKVLFILAQDQSYMRQCDTAPFLSAKFFNATARKDNQLFYDGANFNIAVHIRRGDIAASKNTASTDWEERWLNNDYYVAIVKQVLAVLNTHQNVHIYLFSQGVKEDFAEFLQFSNMHYCLDVNAYDSFLHMVYAEMLISSKSSFSYKPALLSKGIKICPGNFWHSYPASADFVLAGDNASFDHKKLEEACLFANAEPARVAMLSGDIINNQANKYDG